MICLAILFLIALGAIALSGVFWWLEKNGYIGGGPGVE